MFELSSNHFSCHVLPGSKKSALKPSESTARAPVAYSERIMRMLVEGGQVQVGLCKTSCKTTLDPSKVSSSISFFWGLVFVLNILYLLL